MLTLIAALALGQAPAEVTSAEDPPGWWVRAHAESDVLPTRFSRRTLARARAGNALLPAGVATVGASTFLAFAFRGTHAGIWGTGMGLGVGTAALGAGLTASAQERAAVDLRLRNHPIDRKALRTGHALAGTGGLLFVTGATMLVTDRDAGLPIGLTGLGLTGLASIPYGLHTWRTRKAWEELTPRVSPVWDLDRGTQGMAVAVWF